MIGVCDLEIDDVYDPCFNLIDCWRKKEKEKELNVLPVWPPVRGPPKGYETNSMGGKVITVREVNTVRQVVEFEK